MRLRIGAFIQAVLILLMMCIPVAAVAGTAGITVTLDKTSAAIGETVTASGTTEPGAWVPLKVIDEDWAILVFDATKADTNGNYSIGFKVPLGARGTLTVVVGELGNVATASLTVVPAPVPVTGVSIAEGDQELTVGESVQLTAVVEPENATNKNVTWSSSDEDVATVDETGLVTAVSAGTATITVRTQDGGYTDSITVTVVSAHVPVTGVSIAEGDRVKLRAGQTKQLTAVVEPENATNKAVTWSVTWFSGKEAAVTVDQNGLVTAVRPGRATVTVTTQEGGCRDSIDIVVTGPVKKPAAWPPGGAVVRGTRVTLSSTTEGADIYYTLDGTAPTVENDKRKKYTDPIEISEPVTIKAVAVIPDGEESEVLTAAYSIAEPITDKEVAVDSSKKNLAVTKETPEAVSIRVPEKVKDATISVSALLKEPDPGSEVLSTEPLPELNVEVTDTSIGSAAPIKVSIPGGTTVSAPADWNGTINVPRVEPAQSVKVEADPGKKAKVHTVIEVGYGDVPLTFNKAVRLLIPGQAGKEAGYYRGGKFTKIPSLPASARDDQAWADTNLPAGGDGKMDVGSDLVIWTKHFTKFITYTQTAMSTGSDGEAGVTTPSPTPVPPLPERQKLHRGPAGPSAWGMRPPS